MSSIPFVEVAGRFTMPLLRSPAPRSHGREWALLPPHGGIRSRYAAIVHTTCLGIDEFCALCRWEVGGSGLSRPTGKDLAMAASLDRGATPRPIPKWADRPADARAKGAPRRPTESSARPTVGQRIPLRRPSYRAGRRPTRMVRRLMCGAGIVGALTLIGWFLTDEISLQVQRHEKTAGPRIDDGGKALKGKTSSASGAGPAMRDQTTLASTPRGQAPLMTARTTQPQNAPSVESNATGNAVAERDTSPRHAMPSRAIGTDSEAAHHAAAVVSPSPTHRDDGDRHDHADTIFQATRQTARPTSRPGSHDDASRSRSTTPIAGRDSRIVDREQGWLPAGTPQETGPLADIASTPPPRGRSDSRAAGGDWADQISQRRITEVPDQFSK